MKSLTRTLKIAGIICLVSCALGLSALIVDLFVKQLDIANIVFDGIEVVLSVLTGIVYLRLSTEENKVILSKGSLFFGLTLANIFNSLIVWAVAFWVEISVSRANRVDVYVPFGERDPETNGIEVDDYSVKEIKNVLTQKLEEIDELKRKNLISSEEYENMRQEIIDKYI